MAGDWIKMRSELQSHPKVVRILSATKSDKFRVIGGLHAVWAVFDAHSNDGKLYGYTPDLMDHIIGWEGFSAAMIAVEWLLWDEAETLALPEFDEHNSKSAKRRAEDQKRKRNTRNSLEFVSDDCGQIADKKRTREDKREDKEKDKTLLSESPDSSPPNCPIKEIIETYHTELPMLPRVRVMTSARETQIRQRWREEPKRQSLEWWKKFFAYAAKSDFLTGRGNQSGRDTPWMADLEWLTKAGNFAKVIEGKYHA